MPRTLEGRPAPRDEAAGDLYFELVRRFPLRPIRSEQDLDRAIAVVDSLIDKGELSQDEDDYLDVLGDLVRKYETENHPAPAAGSPSSAWMRFVLPSSSTAPGRQSRTVSSSAIPALPRPIGQSS